MAASAAALTAWTASAPARRPVRLRRAPKAGRVLVSAVTAALLALLVLTGFTGRAESASAFSITCPFGTADDAAKNNSSEAFRSGVDALTPFINPANGMLVQAAVNTKGNPVNAVSKNMTAYEYYGMSGATWVTATEDCGAIGSYVGNMTANYMLSATKAVVTISIGMYQWASSPNLLADFQKPMDAVVQGLKQNLYLNFLSPVIVLGALWMAWAGLVKKRSSEATQGAAWMIGSAVFALVFMAWPSFIATQSNSVVSTINSTAMTAVTGATGKAISTSDICYVSGSSTKGSSAGVRMASCSIYKALVFTPWAAGQYGVSNSQPLVDGANKPVVIPGHTASKDLRLSQLEAQAINAAEAARTGDDAREKVKKADTERWEKIQERAEKEVWFSNWSGDSIGGRINVGLAAMLASIGAAALILLISFSSIVLALGMVMLIMVAPLFLLIGAHPGAGRGIALKWLELLIGTVVKRIMLGFLLAIIIGFYQVILATPMAWFSQVALIIAVGVGALMYRKPLMEAMNVVNLGGSRSGFENGTWDRHAKKGGAGLVGAVSGAATAAFDQKANGKGAILAGLAGGALSGGVMGARSGNPMRAAQMGAGAGRRAASRQEGRRAEKDRRDDPFVYDADQKKEAKQAASLQDLVDRYPEDPEMQRRLERWGEKNDRPVPRPGEGAKAPSKDNDQAVPATDQSAPASGPDGTAATPRPDRGTDTAVLPDLDEDQGRPASDRADGGATPRPGASPDLAYSDEQARIDREYDERQAREHAQPRADTGGVLPRQFPPAPSSEGSTLAAETLARVRRQAERDGAKRVPPTGGGSR